MIDSHLPEGDSQSPTSKRLRGRQVRHSRLPAEGSFRPLALGGAGSKETTVRRGIIKMKAWRSHWIEKRGTVNATRVLRETKGRKADPAHLKTHRGKQSPLATLTQSPPGSVQWDLGT